MPLIPEHILDEIQSRVDIAELIGRYVPLKRAGRHFKALCPFHKERTPSFHINTDKQIFHCFGCGAGGNLFSFLMQQERLSFPEAVRQVAEQVGLQLPSEEEHAGSDHRAQLFTVLEKACRYYERLLAHANQGATARRYLDSRGVEHETRAAFRLGCAAGADNHLIRAAAQSATPRELLEEAGLALVGRSGPVDRFRQRLIFPILDVRGRVVGFGGRSLADQTPKYLNSPETPVYTKGRHLFGLAQAKDAIVEAKTAIVVEGYFDCTLLWQAGFRHTVSPLGTAFTPEQARALARYAQRVTLAFDPDAAGETAALRGIEILLEQGLTVHVAQLPAGKDPDELVRVDAALFQRLLDNSLTVLEFLIRCAGNRHDLRDPDQKVQAAKWILAVVAKIPDAMLRAEYVRLLAARLRLDEAAVADELAKVRRRPADAGRPDTEPAITPMASPPSRGAERMLVALVVDQPTRWRTAREHLAPEQLGDPQLRRIMLAIARLREDELAQMTPAQLMSRLTSEQTDDQPIDQLISELVQLAQSIPSKDKVLRESLRRLQLDSQKRRLAELRQELHRAQELGREQELERLLSGYQQLAKGVPAGTEG